MKGYSLNSIREYLNKYNDIENRYEPENGVILSEDLTTHNGSTYLIPFDDPIGYSDFSIGLLC